MPGTANEPGPAAEKRVTFLPSETHSSHHSTSSKPPSPGICSISHGVFNMSKRTFQPNNRRRAKVHGFRIRMRTRAGRAIVAARRGKGRSKLTA